MCTILNSILAKDPPPQTIGDYVITPIKNKLYVDSCKWTEYKYDSLKAPSLKNPSKNVFTDLFNDLTDPAIAFMKAGTYVSLNIESNNHRIGKLFQNWGQKHCRK